MTESGVWSERFRLRSYETDPTGLASVATVCNYLQEVAGNHAFRLGLSVEHLHERRLTWVLARLRVLVDRYPRWREEITVETWPSGIDGLLGTRDFLLLDDDGERLARATSGWMVIDVDRRRPVRMPESVTSLAAPDRERAVAELSGRLPYASSGGGSGAGGDGGEDAGSGSGEGSGGGGGEGSDSGSGEGSGKGEGSGGGSGASHGDGATRKHHGTARSDVGSTAGRETGGSPVRVEYADLDVNGHVNNVRYVEWALETMGAEHHAAHEVAELEIQFKAEAVYGDAAVIRTAQIVDAPPQPPLSAYSHVILKSGTSRELARLRTVWRPR